MVLQSLQNWGYNLENMRKSNHPPDLLLGFWDLHVLNGGHFIRIWAPFIRSDDMPHKFDLALSKATFLNIKCETRLFDDLQKLFQIYQMLVKLIRVHGNIIHKRGRDISYGMQNFLDSSDKVFPLPF